MNVKYLSGEPLWGFGNIMRSGRIWEYMSLCTVRRPIAKTGPVAHGFVVPLMRTFVGALKISWEVKESENTCRYVLLGGPKLRTVLCRNGLHYIRRVKHLYPASERTLRCRITAGNSRPSVVLLQVVCVLQCVAGVGASGAECYTGKVHSTHFLRRGRWWG